VSSIHIDTKSSGPHNASVTDFIGKNPIFVCVTSYTETSQIPGITIAGANPELIPCTPAADAEFLYYGRCKSISGVPATPDGIPTPALITRAALRRSRIPILIVDAGSKIKPQLPAISFGIKYGRDIRNQRALERADAERAFEFGKMIGIQLAMSNDILIIGESIPGGTTTALAVLTALGIDAKNKISSSMSVNPHELKNEVVSIAMRGLEDQILQLRNDPIDLVSRIGDPMIPSVAGIASGAISQKTRVMLAGGTQMTAVLCLLKAMQIPLDGICIGTTSYVKNDKSSDILKLVRSICDNVPILSVELGLEFSIKKGLRMYNSGIAKEGVGAGGAAITSILKSKGNLDPTSLLHSIEIEYEISIESQRVGSLQSS
jgi:uncharacterized protein (TIGR00303 family)